MPNPTPGQPVNLGRPAEVLAAAREVRYALGTAVPVRLMTWGEALLYLDCYALGCRQRVDAHGRLIPFSIREAGASNKRPHATTEAA